ncbi:PREDICTED: RNA polymerase II-associated factor 1 homolog [Priapulus caudatus]|uniref:RNA polymerase II-associated factor 1 homolog n=1 Tax=Priapulus caudatus TaxID=37621 RepID=A0ABM1EY82_PRICU|nr:PREDICTED: RNA polymerase II-associated factor 1 homolog [Priapulus caudatus]
MKNIVTQKRSDLVVRVKYCNTLPDIPFDPKFITYPFESNRFVQYNPTSLERNYKHDLLTEHDLGVNIDLIDPDTYKVDYNDVLDPADEKLLEEDVATPQDSKRSRQHSKTVSWMRKTEYISTEYNRFTPSAEKAEAKIGYSVRKKFKEDDMYKDRESQLQAIDKSFEQANEPIAKHYSKPGVTPVEVLPLFPDFNGWIHPCAQVIFDRDPAPQGISQPAQLEEMSQALIRGMMDEEGNQFVAYFLPTEETLKKRKRDQEESIEYNDEEVYDYTIARSYNWTVKNKASRGYEENYVIIFHKDSVSYNELETKVCLSKRRMKDGSFHTQKSRLLVRHRPLTEMEHNAQQARLKALEPPTEEDEEDIAEMEEEEKVDQSDEDKASGSDKEGSDHESVAGSQRSRIRSRSHSQSRSRSGSRSPSRSRSRSRSGSRSRSRSRSGSGSPSGSEAGSGGNASDQHSGSEKAGSDAEHSGGSSGSESEEEQVKANAEKEIFGSVSGSEDSD